ncbi:glycine zipper domain-containing protein [Namhaeicola litoreus]|uniref:Glycine zipper domain-containing protein n=1 Tax=Namhaeicola litoreus TaxID=1052145 RepID=A0ABW3Y101_9FLAO
MKNLNYLIILVLSFAGLMDTDAQETSIAKSLGLYAFPGKDQDAKTQDADESVCFKWAMEQTGYDPLNPTKVTAAKTDTSPDGSAIVGAAGGAAAGAAIGAIAGDTGKGAAIGAVVGGLAGRRSKRMGDAHEQQANNQVAEQEQAQLLNDYKKAFSACLEAKGYTVK